MKNFKKEILKKAAIKTWDPQAAYSGLERWSSLCDRENWGDVPANMDLLAQLFGSSWYFTRFIFYQGKSITTMIDNPDLPDLSYQGMLEMLCEIPRNDDLELQLDQLRINKNNLMFQIFLGNLRGDLDQQQQELALSHLAEATLYVVLDSVLSYRNMNPEGLSVLAMGRMAGREMTYGSDLDLIFLYDSDAGSEQITFIKIIQSLLRHIASPSPHGILYEIDMRLRPHGTSGTLISPMNYFIEYHQGDREVWERQLMTRCRPIIDDSGLAASALETISPYIYASYNQEQLSEEIYAMRLRVEKELGNPKGKMEIKRGQGGIMDIDFLTHYLQLNYGHKISQLRSTSTREVLTASSECDVIDRNLSDELLKNYNYLKRLESVLRVMDMKSTSAFSFSDNEQERLANAMNVPVECQDTTPDNFQDKYSMITTATRQSFLKILNKPPSN